MLTDEERSDLKSKIFEGFNQLTEDEQDVILNLLTAYTQSHVNK